MTDNNECPINHDYMREELEAYQSDLHRIREEVAMLRRENRNLKYAIDAVLDKAAGGAR